ncbi:DUF6292 family protein [Rhodococcus sp. C3V]|uniref:DUF6292 family protein n=1 Tax=Rhodococcus sp. C3V TaxID=3034165 RepID=UPI0023E16D71|nr:DUF6292 family protein [Rhodococcus sp. C3V]MDF3315625.1 DUF6292 family protein [Rhodococcus sp. C3V]
MHTNGNDWSAHEYIDAVARSVHGETVRWPQWPSMDAVIVLPVHARHHPGKNAVLLWNHDFGWSWGVEEADVRRTISIVDTLGIGRTPDPLRCADRVIELISARAVCSRMCSEE